MFFSKKKELNTPKKTESSNQFEEYKEALNNMLKEIFHKIKDANIPYDADSIINAMDLDTEIVDGVTVSNIQQLSGIIIDDDQNQMAVFSIENAGLNYFLKEKKLQYFCEIMHLSDLLGVAYVENNRVVYNSTVSNKGLLKRLAVGTILAGEVGAVIGAVTVKKNIDTVMKQYNDGELYIGFNNEKISELAWSSHSYYLRNYRALVENYKDDYIRCDVVNPNYTYLSIRAFDVAPSYDRKETILEQVQISGDSKIPQEILRQLERVIKKYDKQKNIEVEKNPIDELKKLNELKELGILSEDEFLVMKSKIING